MHSERGTSRHDQDRGQDSNPEGLHLGGASLKPSDQTEKDGQIHNWLGEYPAKTLLYSRHAPPRRKLTPVEVLQRLLRRLEKRMEALQRVKLAGYEIVINRT
jgi:hypothetical protein